MLINKIFVRAFFCADKQVIVKAPKAPKAPKLLHG